MCRILSISLETLQVYNNDNNTLNCLFCITNIVDNPRSLYRYTWKGLSISHGTLGLLPQNGEMEVSTGEEDPSCSCSDCVFVYSAVRAGSPAFARGTTKTTSTAAAAAATAASSSPATATTATTATPGTTATTAATSPGAATNATSSRHP